VSEANSRVINAVCPIRVCDLGGWTDTWFAGEGAILNVGVYPYAEVQIIVRKLPDHEPRVVINAENYGERYELTPGDYKYDRHPLLEAALDIMELPEELGFEVNIYSEAPAGASTGTSAAVTTSLLGALDLLSPGQRTPHEMARLGHRVETEKLGLQCGIQDQLCSAYGGICFIEMFDYPHASISQLQIPNSLWWEFERRLVLVYLGSAHSSSDVHGSVIERLEADGADKSDLKELAAAARDGKNALLEGRLDAFGEVMRRNTEAQASLHPKLVSETARAVGRLAEEHGAVGWKVNGAGGEGGSVTVLCGTRNDEKRAFINSLKELGAGVQVIPTYLSRTGLRRWIAEG
jgi:D-glycero-alpha-D-manno-heptose-7-phosphate kinase